MNFDSYKGVFNIDLLDGMIPSGDMDIPTILRTDAHPKSLISFDKAVQAKQYNNWVHFFIHDQAFMRLWRNPWKYYSILADHQGVISPDFSIFWDYPLFIQFESVCRSRIIGSWLQQNGIPVIPCVRWGKKETFSFAFEGIESGGTVAVGTAGCMREKEIRQVFEEGFPAMLERINPRRVVVYGSRRSPVFSEAEQAGIEIVSFETNTASVFDKKVS